MANQRRIRESRLVWVETKGNHTARQQIVLGIAVPDKRAEFWGAHVVGEVFHSPDPQASRFEQPINESADPPLPRSLPPLPRSAEHWPPLCEENTICIKDPPRIWRIDPDQILFGQSMKQEPPFMVGGSAGRAF